MARKRSLAALAAEQVPFAVAARWAGLDGGDRDHGVKVSCPSCGGKGDARLYPSGLWCFSEAKRFGTVALLALVWNMDRETAAGQALARYGYTPPGYGSLFREARREPEPAREDLADALRIWCAANCRDWTTVQYDRAVSGKLAECLSLLPLVTTAGQCGEWLERCKAAMSRAFASVLAMST
jgi:hypothetical protein